MSTDARHGGGEDDRLAPVTPLFGGDRDSPPRRRPSFSPSESDTDADRRSDAERRSRYDADGWWVEPDADGGVETDAGSGSGADSRRGITPTSAFDTHEPEAEATPVPIRSARSLGDDERGSRHRHPSANPAGLMRASDLLGRSEGERESVHLPWSDTDATGEGGDAATAAGRRGRSGGRRESTRPPLRAMPSSGTSDDDGASAPPSDAELREAGERKLLKRLHGRGMSVAEATTFLRGQDVASHDAEAIIEEFVARGYLDDAALAEQLVYAGVSRKAQGRRAIAQALSARGIPREVIDVALSELPDDDEERALDFARTKARSLASLERDTALRRLVGQLSRRGFPSNVAMSAARTALDEAGVGTGPRFR